jgi:MoxR-like ATPase
MRTTNQSKVIVSLHALKKPYAMQAGNYAIMPKKSLILILNYALVANFLKEREFMQYDLMSLRKAFAAENYIFDEDFLLTVYLALKLNKPLLVEGAAGVGKTETAKVLANIFATPLIRLQCYEGLDETKALYEWNYQKQLLDIQIKKDSCTQIEVKSLFSKDYLLERPLLQAIQSEKTSVLLIDEVDKTDEAFEAFLLELLSDFQVSIPELGTITATTLPVIVLTSNASRDLSDSLKRRCVYLYLDYPSIEKEIKILHVKVPGIEAKLSKEIAAAANYLRNHSAMHKKPSIAETIDWAAALVSLKEPKLSEETIQKTSGVIFKNKDDMHIFTQEKEIETMLSTIHGKASKTDHNCACSGKMSNE